MDAQAIGSEANVVVDLGSDPRRQAARDVVVRVTRAALAGSDLRVERRSAAASDRIARRVTTVERPRSAALVAVARLVAVTELRRGHVPLRALVLDPPRPPRGILEPWLDELRAHDRIDDLFEWLLRGRPRERELALERLSLVSRSSGDARFAAQMVEAREWGGARALRGPRA
jgi:hypothetical protein